MSRQDCIFKNYILLRDAAELDWQDPKIMSGMWLEVHHATELAKLCVRPAVHFDTNDPDPEEASIMTPEGKMTCGHCRSCKLRPLVCPLIRGDKKGCPL